MTNITSIFPADDFSVVAENAVKDLDSGLIIGYDKEGKMLVFGGGLIDGRRPVAKDFLWLVETFRAKLINGDYAE